MADEDTRSAPDVPQVSINDEASNLPSTQQSQGNADVTMADVPTDQAVRPVYYYISMCFRDFAAPMAFPTAFRDASLID